MSQILSPEQEARELEGEMGLKELAQELEPGHEKVQNFDIVYGKDPAETAEINGSVYRPQGTGSEWYDEDEIDPVEIPDLEIDVEQVKLNAVTGETVLVNSSGGETRYDVFSSFEGTTTFTQEVGRSTFVFRYDKHEGEVNAAEIGGNETVEWANDELKKKVRLVDRMYHEARENLWKRKSKDSELKNKTSKFDQLRPIYDAVTNRIEQDGKAVINEKTHVGSSRGADIVNDFFTATVRHPEDSPDNYEESSGKGSYPIEIQPADDIQ